MNTDRDTTRIVRSWLQTDEYESADHVLDTVLDQLDTTPQRRAGWLGRRLPTMNNTAKLTLTLPGPRDWDRRAGSDTECHARAAGSGRRSTGPRHLHH
jgi:hypothetical protein